MNEEVKQEAIKNLEKLIEQQEEIIAIANNRKSDYMIQQYMLETGNKINMFKPSNT